MILSENIHISFILHSQNKGDHLDASKITAVLSPAEYCIRVLCPSGWFLWKPGELQSLFLQEGFAAFSYPFLSECGKNA